MSQENGGSVSLLAVGVVAQESSTLKAQLTRTRGTSELSFTLSTEKIIADTAVSSGRRVTDNRRRPT